MLRRRDWLKGLFRDTQNPFNSARQPSADHALNEMIIAGNGPLLHHVDKILDRAMERYWKEHSVKGKWQFLRNTQDIRT